MNNPHLNIQQSVKDRRAGQNNSRGRRWREVLRWRVVIVAKLCFSGIENLFLHKRRTKVAGFR